MRGRLITCAAAAILVAGGVLADSVRAETLVLWSADGIGLVPNGDVRLGSVAGGTLVETGTNSAWGAGVRLALRPSADWDRFAWVSVDVSNATDRVRLFCLEFAHPGTAWDPNVAARQSVLRPHEVRAVRLPVFSDPRSLDKSVDFMAMRGFPRANGGRGFRSGEPLELRAHCLDVAQPGAFVVRSVALTGTARARAPLRKATFFPFVDRFGQFAHDSWPGKIESDEDLVRRLRDEESFLAASGASPIPGADAYGGWGAGPRLKATGRFRTEKVDGRWWLVDPDGHLFFSQGIDCVRLGRNSSPVSQRENYYAWLPKKGDPVFGVAWQTFRKPAAHLFYRENGNWPYESVDLTLVNLMRKYGAGYPGAAIEDCHRRLWAWGVNTMGNWSEYDVCTNGARRTPYVATFATVAAPRLASAKEGYWGRFPDSRSPAFAQCVREGLGRLKRAGILDDRYLIGVFVDNELTWAGVDAATCERYFKVIEDAFREIAPDVLYLGCRFASGDEMGGKVAWQAAARHCDVLSANRYQVSACVPQQADGLDKPVLIGEFHFGALDRGCFHPGLVPVNDQVERAAAYKAYVRAALDDPRIVGAHWFEWRDQPLAGRSLDGENYQIGFVDVCDTPYPEMVAASRELAREMYARRSRTSSIPASPDGRELSPYP